MRWQLAWTFALTASAACYGPNTVDCGDGFLCPASMACAEPNVCGAPALVAQCFEESRPKFHSCDFTGTIPGTCLQGVCSECTQDLAGCSFPVWTQMTSPVTTSLKAVWALPTLEQEPPAPEEPYVLAGGDEGILLEYEGEGWSRSASYTGTGPIVAIWGSASNDIYVSTTPKLFHWDGTSWTDVSPLLPADAGQIYDITGTAPNFVVAVGDAGTFLRFDGTTWRDLSPPPGPPLNGVAIGPSVTAVGGAGYVFTSDGDVQATSQVSELGALEFRDVAWTSSGLVAVGQGGGGAGIAIFDGEWKRPPIDAGIDTSTTFYGVWSDGTAAFATGASGNIARLDADGTWRLQIDLTSTLRAITGSDATHVYAVGDDGAIWRFVP